MATVAITPAQLVNDTMSADLPVTAGTAIVAADTNTFAFPEQGKLLIVLNNTYAGDRTFTFAAGFGVAAGQGSLTLTLAQDDVRFIMLSSDRFKDAGIVSLTYQASTTGYVMAFYTAP